jgi:hypothetical protein
LTVDKQAGKPLRHKSNHILVDVYEEQEHLLTVFGSLILFFRFASPVWAAASRTHISDGQSRVAGSITLLRDQFEMKSDETCSMLGKESSFETRSISEATVEQTNSRA